MLCTYFFREPHGKTTESYSFKMHSCNLSVRPHRFQQRHKLQCCEWMECFKNPLWSRSYMASIISKYLHTACRLQEYTVLCAFEKKRENLFLWVEWSWNVRLCVRILEHYYQAAKWMSDINTVTCVFPHFQRCAQSRISKLFGKAALLTLAQHHHGWANTHMWQPWIRKW